MEENNKEPVKEMAQEEQYKAPEQKTTNEFQEQNPESKFKPLGEVKEKAPKKKKSKVGVIIFILLLLVAIIVGLVYYYFKVYTNPTAMYQKILKARITSLAESPDEMTTIKAKAKLDADLNLNESYMETGVEELLNLINKTDATIEIQMDTNEKKAYLKFDSNYENEELLNFDLLFDTQSRGTYLKIEQFFDKVLEVEMDDSYYDELEEALEIEKETAGQKLSRSKAVGILNTEFEKIIKDEYCSKEKEKITVNSQEINADKYILKITYEELREELITALENLKNNDEFLNCFEEKENKREELQEAIDEIKAERTQEATIYINLYKTGIKQEFVRVDFVVESNEEKITFKVEKAEETYKFEMFSEEETYCAGTLGIEKVDETTTKINLKLEIEEVGTIALNMEYGVVLNEPIDTMEIENTVNIEELSEADMLKLYENLQKSKLYDVFEEFIAISSENSGLEENVEIETPNITSDRTKNDIEKNISISGELTEKANLVVFAKNNNTTSVDMEIEVEFYDANGKILGSSSDDLIAVGSGREVAIEMWNTPTNFDTYKIYVDAEKTYETDYFNQIEMVHNNNGTNIVVQVKNNSEDTIEFMTVSVVYYNEGKVVGITDGIVSDIKPGRSGNFNLDYPYNSEYENVKFDDYKVFVTEAYSYNW